MRRLCLSLLILLSGFVNFCFCQEKKLVVATASIFADMAINLGGDQIEVRSIVPIGGDPHTHEPTPVDAQLVAKADLILKNGLTFEGWLNELIENAGTKAKIVLITEGVDPIESLTYQNATDPHAWMSAQKGLIYLKNIKDALVQLVPEHKEMFEFNYGVYRKQLLDVDSTIRAQVKEIPIEKRILITSHDAFRYYGNEYGIRVESVLGTSTDADIQTSDIIRLNKIIKEYSIPAIFVESTINPKVLEQIASDNHIKIGGELFSDSIGDEESPAPSYLDMLLHNTQIIVEGLTTTPNPSTPIEMPETESEPLKTGAGNWYYIGLIAVLILGLVVVARRLN